MQRIRPILFWSFIILFFITAFAVLFYAFGYRFSFARGIFVYTGSITLKTNPETVSIRLDHRDIPARQQNIINDSFHLPGLAPGEHFVEVSAPGYQTWSKKTVVQSGLSSEFWNILLVRSKPALTSLPHTTFAQGIYPSPKRNTVAVSKIIDGEFSVDVINTKDLVSEQVFSLPNASALPPSLGSLRWNADGTLLLVPVGLDETIAFYIVDRATKKAARLDDIVTLTAAPFDVRWDPADKQYLYYREGDDLSRKNINTAAPSEKIAENVSGYDFSGRNVYFLRGEDGLVYRIPNGRSGETPAQVTTHPITPSTGDFKLTVYDDARLALLNRQTGSLWTFNRELRDQPLRLIASDGIDTASFSDDGKKLLFSSPYEISVLFLRDWDVQPIRTAGSIAQIARFSTPIRHVQWVKDYEHVLFSVNGAVKMIELDHRDRRNIFDIASLAAPAIQVVSSFDEDTIYFVSSENKNTNTISSLSFPEATGFFGF